MLISTPMRRTRSGCCARADRGHAAAVPPSSLMNARLFTDQYLPCFRPKGIARLGTAALRDFDPANDRLGSKSVIAVMSAARPLFHRKTEVHPRSCHDANVPLPDSCTAANARGCTAYSITATMKRERTDRWRRTRLSRARFSGSDVSHRMRCLAGCITSIAESSFRYTQPAWQLRHVYEGKQNPRPGRPGAAARGARRRVRSGCRGDGARGAFAFARRHRHV
jgi:hypothetical protein